MNRKRLALIVLLMAFCFTTIYLSAGNGYSNDIVRYVAKLKNKIPNRYTAPTESQVSILRQAVLHIFRGKPLDAQTLANGVDYRVRKFKHTNGLYYYILESKNPKHRPWGTYIIYPWSDAVHTIVEIPHPVSEKNAANIGIKLFINSKAMAFLLSGSRRSKCDVAHTPETVFQGIHEEITSATTDVVQIHTFKIYSYPQIVITSGTPVAAAGINKYVDKLIEENSNGDRIKFEVGIYDGVQYARLASTENLQAQHTNSVGGDFIGIFLNRTVAQSTRRKSRFITLTETAISETTVLETTLIETPLI